MARPKKIVLKSDEMKRFGSEVFDLIRTKLAPGVGGNVNLAVKLAAEHFAPRKPGEVKAEEMEGAISQIAAKFAEETKSTSDSRLPFDDEMQASWDAGELKGQVTVRGIRERFAKEIGDGVDLTKSMVFNYVEELEAEKARVAALIDERPDPDLGEAECVFSAHPENEDRKFQPTARYRLTRNDKGELIRMKHPRGEEFVQVGNILVNEEEVRTELYCANCRDLLWAEARNAVDPETGKPQPVKITFYTAASAKRKLAAITKTEEGHTAAREVLRSAGAKRLGGSYGTRKNRANDWRFSRVRIQK